MTISFRIHTTAYIGKKKKPNKKQLVHNILKTFNTKPTTVSQCK